jgi:hypothetical protein
MAAYREHSGRTGVLYRSTPTRWDVQLTASAEPSGAGRPLPPGSSDSNMSAEEFESVLASMVEKGWPADVVEQIRADRMEGAHRVNVLTINDTARGLSRYGVEKLVRAGKLRLFTIAPMYQDQKPETRIPAKDILALR